MKIKHHVMVLDGNATLRLMVKTILEMGDYRVTTCKFPEALRSEVKNCRPDVILCDIHYSKIDGREICKAFKADPETANIPFIIYTAQPDCWSSSMAAGADFFLEKPFEIDFLCQKVGEAAALELPEPKKESFDIS